MPRLVVPRSKPQRCMTARTGRRGARVSPRNVLQTIEVSEQYNLVRIRGWKRLPERRPAGFPCAVPARRDQVSAMRRRRRGLRGEPLVLKGVIPNRSAATRARPTANGSAKSLNRYQNNRPLWTCSGYRLRPAKALAVKIGRVRRKARDAAPCGPES